MIRTGPQGVIKNLIYSIDRQIHICRATEIVLHTTIAFYDGGLTSVLLRVWGAPVKPTVVLEMPPAIKYIEIVSRRSCDRASCLSLAIQVHEANSVITDR